MKLNKKQIKNIIKSYDLESIMELEEDARNDEINDIILECLETEKIEPFTEEWDTLYSQYEDIIYPMIDKEFTTIKLGKIYDDLDLFLWCESDNLTTEQFETLYEIKKALINLKKGEKRPHDKA